MASSSANATSRLNPPSSARPSAALSGRPRSSTGSCSTQKPTAVAPACAPSPAPDSNARNHTPSTSLPASLFTRLRERLQQPLPIFVILADGFPPAAPCRSRTKAGRPNSSLRSPQHTLHPELPRLLPLPVGQGAGRGAGLLGVVYPAVLAADRPRISDAQLPSHPPPD